MVARNVFSLFALLGILVFFVGCGQKLPGDMPQLYPTQVVLTAEDGTPLDRAQVTLHPADGGTETSAGITNDRGIAEIVTRGKYSGAPAGSYKVTVYWTIGLDGPTASRPAPTDPKELAAYNERVGREKVFKPALEPQYNDSQNTPLTCEVSSGKNSVELVVKKLDPPPTR